jgi:hypothetical protein
MCVAGSLGIWIQWLLPLIVVVALGTVARAVARRHAQVLSPHILASTALLVWLAARSSVLLADSSTEDLSLLVASYRIPSSRLVVMGATALLLLLVAFFRYRAMLGAALFFWLSADTAAGVFANLALPHTFSDAAMSRLQSLATASHWIGVAAGSVLSVVTLLSFVRTPRDERASSTRQWLPVIVAAWLGALPLHANVRQRERAMALRLEQAMETLDVQPLRVAHGAPWRSSAFAVVGRSGEIWLGEDDLFVRVAPAEALPAIRDSELVLFVSHEARVADLTAALARVPREVKVSLGRLSAAGIAPAAMSRMAVARDIALGASALRIYREGDYIPDKVMRDGQPEPSPSVGFSLNASEGPLRMLPSRLDYLKTNAAPAAARAARWQRAAEVSLSPHAILAADSPPVVVAIMSFTLLTLYALRTRRSNG